MIRLLLLLLIPISATAQTNYSINDNTNPYLVDNQTKINTNNNIIKQNPVLISNQYKHLIANSNKINGCWDRAAKTYNLDPWLLVAYAKVESNFNGNAINKNKNKSTDMGMMQINTIWLPTLRKFNISTQDLFNPCTSIFVGAWIVAQNINRFGYNIDGIGAYNAPNNLKLRRIYGKKVYQAYNQLMYDFYPHLSTLKK